VRTAAVRETHIGVVFMVGDLRELARMMATFHARADRSAAITADGGRDALRARWAANLTELAAFAGTVLDAALVDALGTLSMRFLDGRAPLFQDRQDADRIVDGHGDLIAADVFCLDDGPRVLDCLEFDDRLRHVDGLDDVAFLAMDLGRLGRADLADRFLDAYAEFSGDPAPVALRHHYVAYRAVVRAKVACLRIGQGDGAAAKDASAYATLALQHLERGAVRLALVGGLPGTGKSTLGGALADRFGAALISSDRVRKELAGIDPEEDARAPFREGLYTEERTASTYAELLRRAEMLLARGESVVLDASWTCARYRRAAEELALRTGSDLLQLRCCTAVDTAGRRIVTRRRTASDATAAVALAMSAETEPWPEAVTIPTDGTVTDSLEVAVPVWR
jgi:predicted kinase